MRFSTATFALATLVASAAAHPHAPVVNHEDIAKRHNVARELETVHTANIPHHIRFPGTHDLDDVPEWLEYDGPEDDDNLVAPAYSDDWTVPEDQDYVKNITKVNPRDLEELEARATRKSGLAWSNQVPKGLSQFNGSTTFGVYNWGTYWIPELKQRGIKYFPMLKSYEKRESFRQTVTQGYGNGGWVMAMNEVNHNDQAPMDPGRANWMIQTYLLPLKKAKNGKPGFKLVCPSVANGPTGIAWYDKFYKNHRATFDQCDAISVHYYGVEHQKVIDWMQMFYDRYKKPIWLTEYGCNSWSGKYCTASYARTFVQKIGSFCQSKWWCQTHMLFGTFQNTYTYSGVSKVNGIFSSSGGSLSEIGRIFKSL